MKNLLIIVCLFAFTIAKAGQSPQPISITDLRIDGNLANGHGFFTLQGRAQVEDSHGGVLTVLRGPVALAQLPVNSKWRVQAEGDQFLIHFERGGKFPIEIKFEAGVQQSNGWNHIEFRVAPSMLQPIRLKGVPADTQLHLEGAAPPQYQDGEFRGFLAGDGKVELRWKEAPKPTEGKLFYSAEMLSQVSIRPGLLRQVALLDFKVMQGELSRVVVALRGPGEVTRVQGEQILAWKIEPTANASERRLIVQLNQPQKDQFALQVQTQAALGAFPQTIEVLQLHPEAATRFAGYFRIFNEGAVRLEVTQAKGLSQISPEQFPENDLTRAALRPGGSQRFVYRFSSADFDLQVGADQILPELSVSEVLSYRLGQNELTIDGEFELDIREAPLRELSLRLPAEYAVAQVNAAGLSDYFQVEAGNQAQAELRLVFAQPISGRQIVQLRLERNKALGQPSWTLPRLEILKAKSVRGHIATVADSGFRLSPERTSGLTEIASALFPRKVPAIQSAFRISDPAWQAVVRVERLSQTVQADVLHLFSIGEGIAYGSTVLNYAVSGAPVSVFKVALSDEYFNVEFTGKDVRNWQKVAGGYEVQLHTPVAGSYTLLATYERPFKPQGETLTFTGARPLDVQSEQGHTVIVSAYQFQVKAVDVSPGLMPLEPGEVPAEYRLLFDAPILAAYRYLARPFNLQLALSPLAQGDSLSLVIDRAALTTRISKEGQVLTDGRYFVKNRGNPHLRLRLAKGTRLWSVLVNGSPVVPVSDADSDLVPLPRGTDPNSVLTVDFKLASVAADPKHVPVVAPIVNAPLMLAEWRLGPDVGQRLLYERGSLRPIGGARDISGFAQISQALGQSMAPASSVLLGAALACLVAVLGLRWAAGAPFRFSSRHLVGLALGLLAVVTMAAALNEFANHIAVAHAESASELNFVAPVQQANTAMNIEVLNLEDKPSFGRQLGAAWPALLALPCWAVAALLASGLRRNLALVLGWVLAGWGGLALANGAFFFLAVAAAFVLVHLLGPLILDWWKVPARKPDAEVGASSAGAASAGATLLVGLLVWIITWTASAATHESSRAEQVGGPEVVLHRIKVDERFGYGWAKIHWEANKGEMLPLLFEPAVLTAIRYPADAFKLERVPIVTVPGKMDVLTNSSWMQRLVAKRRGTFDLELEYQVPVEEHGDRKEFFLPVPSGVINRLSLTIVNRDVEVSSPQAVSVHSELTSSNTVAEVVLSPAPRVRLEWKPRSRDVQHEQPVFYAELSQLYAPAAGVIESAHLVSVRLAQGELSELAFDVPRGVTVTDVIDPSHAASNEASGRPGPGSVVSLWRFDPDARKLRVAFVSPQVRPFTLLIRSQVAAGPLPVEQSLGTIAVEGAADQIGLVGLATGSDVQLDSAVSGSLSPINLEDFPADLVALLKPGNPAVTLRRAFRYGKAGAELSLRASAVEPDVRVESQETVSLGEDRTVLAVNTVAAITRAGIFRLSFVLPTGFDVESISGQAMSHWTQARQETNQVITLHLTARTEGQQTFAISLVGPGARATNGWVAPQLVFREASKQSGSILLVPEQGLRLQLAEAEGLAQLDPQKSGIKQKGVLAFRILQNARRLVLNLEQVNAWIQVSSLQHAKVGEAQVKIIANLQYQIENTGLKTFHVFIPTNAETVRFEGDQVSDFLPVAAALTNGLQLWEVRLQRRMIGPYLLQLNYQQPVPQNANQWILRGVQVTEVNLQRGFVTVESSGRLQLQVDSPPATLQSAEWQSIPRVLQQGLQGNAANFSYRLVEPDFELPLKLQRFPAAQLLPGRITSVCFNSVVADDGVMLTQAKLEMLPGSKRLLRLTLPANAQFWFTFVSQNGVWPWREKDQILIPLEQPSDATQPVPVELFYTCKVGQANRRAADLQLLAPQFDLPLENITWRVSFADKWELKKWSGSLQLQQEEVVPVSTGLDLQNYLQSETQQQEQRTKTAENFLAAANSALVQGDPQQARRAFQAAYGLSTHDAAFNEDARVQLHNIKLQEALVALNVRQALASGDAGALGGKLRELRDRKVANYTQQDAKDIIERNSSDENAAFMKLAERLIQQQDAAASVPAALHATIPEQGRVLIFKRAVLIDPWAELGLHIRIGAAAAATWFTHGLFLCGMFALFILLLWLAKYRREPARQ